MAEGGHRERLAAVEALILDVDGVLTDGRLHYGEATEPTKSFHVRDGLGLALLKEAGYRVALVSGRSEEAVRRRAADLGIEDCLLGRRDKDRALAELLERWDLPAERVAAVGDDLFDLPLLTRVGYACAPADADPRVRERVDRVLDGKGGEGAVRQLCEMLLMASGKWAPFAERYGLEEESRGA